MWWFEAPARPATPKGHPSSLAEHRFPKSLSYLHQDLRFSFVAHVAGVFDPAHYESGGDPIGGGREGTVELVSCLVAATIGGCDRCIVVVQGTPVVRHERGMEVWM